MLGRSQIEKIGDECAVGIEVEPLRTSTAEQICVITVLAQDLIVESPECCQNFFDQVFICASTLAVSEGNTEGFGHPLPASGMAGGWQLEEIFLGHLKCARIPVTQDGFPGAAQPQYSWQAQPLRINV